MGIDIENLTNQLKKYLNSKQSVEMAFVFGSQVSGTKNIESDLDIAVYFKPKTEKLDYEEEIFFDEENEIWNELEKISKCKVDFVVLNRAPSLLAFSIIKNGKPITIKNRFRYWDFFLKISSEAFDFREFVDDFLAIKSRSQSLSREDKDRIIKLKEFLKTEINDYDDYKDIDFNVYKDDRKKRRSIERWVENIINCSIDIAKILLASNKKQLPDTYVDTLRLLSILPAFDEEKAKKMASFVKLRNIIAHEYLDLRFSQIQDFLKQSRVIYTYLSDYVDNFLKFK